ncbi:Mut7-C RNAse domain-containing protein [Phenylobacterium soli]|nr:Mut7-C RNAse domain-containing protein [Phenylobacterium soli]
MCDEMLARLARLLRAAGYDTLLAADGGRDTPMLQQIKAEGRVLVTRDRRLAERAGPSAVLLSQDKTADQAAALAARLPIDWEHAPFTRCVIDNAPLREADEDEVGRMPADARALGGPYRACPSCGRLYWPGSHVKRMARQLHDLARMRPQA